MSGPVARRLAGIRPRLAPGIPALAFLAIAFMATLMPSLKAISADSTSPPNIVVILADDLGYGDLGCQGARDVKTPHLDAMFASGIRFENAYANCTVCSPT